MPKIIDHAVHKKDLITRAAMYFSEQGYTGASMRKIAAYLGISKGALYHYFPSKEALFLACTEQVMARIEEDYVIPGNASQATKIERLTDVMRRDFGAELVLIIEYMRGKSKEEIAADKAMQTSLGTYYKSVEAIVGAKKANETLALILGKLLLEYMSGDI